MKRTSKKIQSIIKLGLLLAIIIAVNIISSSVYTRLDLTTDKRYTLSDATKTLLDNLEDVVYVQVYLEGEGFPAGFQKLQTATREMLDEMRSYAGSKIQYEFIDPLAGVNADQQKEVYRDMVKKGLQPTSLNIQEEGSYSQKVIFPGAILSYQGKETPLVLLQNQVSLGSQQVLHNSISLLEYGIVNSIKKLVNEQKPKIAFIRGQGELNNDEAYDFKQALDDYYQVDTIHLPTTLFIPANYKSIIIAKPTKSYSEKDKFKIDQYIMRGGNVLWLVESLKADMQYMKEDQVFVTPLNETNLSDQLFKYGIRINNDLIQDLNSLPIPIVVGQLGNAPQTQLYPWPYFPLVFAEAQHPVVKNLDAIAFQFVNSIDTVKSQNVRKTILLKTSPYTKALLYPVRVHLSMLQQKPNPAMYNQPNLPVAVLLEGNFTSVFKNRLAPSTLNMIDTLDELDFKTEGQPSKMIVISDGDVMKNEYTAKGVHYPLGFYRYTEQTYDNKNFLLNAIEYLSDESNLIQTRNREVKIRLLDRIKVKEEAAKWKLFNTVLPIALVILFGLVFNFIRKKKYAK